ncbi:murein hydrolase activator EnvC family protein [Sunxiuqinia elliptica]|uniref:Septal ring factor EnvC (AmiA/AmiB activator) n=1 Tax=Sunxiuqinia elliptica TaxID=655355 RepID=A0A4R6H1Z8_9BACT|nr:peptidoglycan DD-metalloendopeptidase family protein [Sunxiuqinia elliptica]TDO01286.1 septal ring factor EnvC (AmiA/AmiB activator) [Sunxiuqinia elliptica]TDO57797.1 septal ring factor EnvC (AmiA/AmiB activator) [Sunxiuqinia elliptica]
MRSLFLSLFFVLGTLSLLGQSITDLRAKKVNTAQVIKYTSSLLQEAQKSEKASLGKLQLLNSQIQNRNQFIGGIESQIQVLNVYIAENTEVSKMLKADLDGLRKEYAAMIRFAQRNKNSYDALLFLLSSENLNQAYKRMLYLRQYAKYRKSQVEVIQAIDTLLKEKIISLEHQKEQKADLLAEKSSETRQLEGEKLLQRKQVQQLQKQQRQLRKKLREQQKQQEELDREIERLLAEEARKAREKGQFEMTPEQKLLAADFEKNRGRLPWPVERGVITERFGVHAHAVLKNIKVKSNGIEITTQKGSKARAIFDGVVSRVFAISGGNMAVIIRHGSFLSVYSNLKEVHVKAGQKVKTKQEIGAIFSDSADGNKTILKFQVWKESEKMNPEIWITK